MRNLFKHWRVVIIIAFLIMISCSSTPELDFFAEDVTIAIQNNAALVTGIYYFKNITSDRLRVTFYYPFPVDRHHYFPESIWCFTKYHTDTTGIMFTKVFLPAIVDSFVISYKQRFSGRYFRYITTTTAHWKKPIKHARFTIITPDNAPYDVNYKTLADTIIGGERRRTILCENFYPEYDLMITFVSAP